MLALLTSGGIECVQFVIGRYAQLDDLIMNAAGTMAGYFTYRGLNALYRRFREAPRHITG